VAPATQQSGNGARTNFPRAAPETDFFEMCQEHWAAVHASSVAEAWELALSILRPWVESTRAIGCNELTEVMERALAETETTTELAREELKKAEDMLAS
jgi:hypothetical protein